MLPSDLNQSHLQSGQTLHTIYQTWNLYTMQLQGFSAAIDAVIH